MENREFFNAMMLIEKQVALWKLIGLFRTSDFIQDCLLNLEFRCSKWDTDHITSFLFLELYPELIETIELLFAI